MRWPLRNQILLPLLGVVLLILAAVSGAHAWFSWRSVQQQMESELRQLTRTLTETSIPLSANVLRQMQGLSGAGFVVTRQAKVIESTFPESQWQELAQTLSQERSVASIGRQTYRLSSVPVRSASPASATSLSTLHVLMPLENWRTASWKAILPSLLAGTAGFAVACLTGFLIARRVAQPIGKLQAQVEAISRREFLTIPVPSRNDEVADLAHSVNRLSQTLRGYELEIRRGEQQRTLAQLGAGIAHQLRNSATGCRMAIDLHALRHPVPGDETLGVALRQLDVMERYLRRFLELSEGGRREGQHRKPVSLPEVVRAAFELMAPYGRHLDVRLEQAAGRDVASPALMVDGDCFDLEQLLIILIRNGIEAAASLRNPGLETPQVLVSAFFDQALIVLEVMDNGPGPSPAVLPRLFEPFVSDKPEGTGLGLSVARAIAIEHDGQVVFQRRDDQSIFRVELPRSGV